MKCDVDTMAGSAGERGRRKEGKLASARARARELAMPICPYACTLCSLCAFEERGRVRVLLLPRLPTLSHSLSLSLFLCVSNSWLLSIYLAPPLSGFSKRPRRDRKRLRSLFYLFYRGEKGARCAFERHNFQFYRMHLIPP